MTYNRATAPAALLAFFKSLLRMPYSETSPPGSYGDGHLWEPGDGRPTHLCCSGANRYVVLSQIGIDISAGNPGNALGHWNAHASLRVSIPAPGDLLYFRGATPPVGHEGMCVTFDAKTGLGTYISAYDTRDGLCIKPFSIHGGADGYVGAVRIVDELPAPPTPKPTTPQRIVSGMYWVQNHANTGKWLVLDKDKAGIPTIDDFEYLQAHTVPQKKLTQPQIDTLKIVRWGSL